MTDNAQPQPLPQPQPQPLPQPGAASPFVCEACGEQVNYGPGGAPERICPDCLARALDSLRQ